jgi:GNAT superfamily N-acetyltransferase
MIRVREARDTDVGQIRDIFHAVYGDDYPHRELYDEIWLKRAVFTEDALVLVAEEAETGRVVGTASVLFDFGAYSDLIAEFGRLAVHPDFRRLNVGNLLMQQRLEAIKGRLHVGLVVARTVHPFAQRIALAHQFVPVGFLPLTHVFQRRESFALLARYFGDGLALRRNNPRILPEIHPLAATVMEGIGLTPDCIVDEESAAYESDAEFAVEEMRAEGYPALLRIERGRVRRREVFGPVRLEYGYFRLRTRATTYLLARDRGQVLGAVGFMLDPVERTVRVFELIASTDQVGRFLLSELERRSREVWRAAVIEIDVSAYAPSMQRTLLELQFQPVAYVPAMVFHEVERLDIVKMMRLVELEDLGSVALEPPVERLAVLVMRGFAERAVTPRMARAMLEVPLFDGMTEEQATRLAAMCRVATVPAATTLFAAGDAADSLYLVLDGRVRVTAGLPEATLATVGAGELLGELSLLTRLPRSATACTATAVEAAVLRHDDLGELVRRRPDIGLVIYRNLAVGLGAKLKRMSEPRDARASLD